jgi:16S rRNA (cytosine967-C5)-methyltransferase
LLREAWALAIEALSWMQMQRLSESLALLRTARQLEISDSATIQLAHMLVYETVRRQNFIDRFINVALKPKKMAELDRGVQAFLRLYVYQTRIARNWSRVDIGGAQRTADLVRSILGWKALQEVEPFLGILLIQKPNFITEHVTDEERIGLRTFNPSWFVKYCSRLFGRTQTIAMLEADLKRAPTYIRLNTLKLSESEILERLEVEGVKVAKVDQLRYAYKVDGNKVSLVKATGLKEGLFYIQDKASCFASEAADPKPGMVLFDVCAAPGAKTTYLAQLMKNRGTIYSIDFSRRRMNLWKAETRRMGVEIAEPVLADARGPLPLNYRADIVVLDPPCTGTGTFRKIPSAKWRLTQRSVDKMAEIQWRILNSCAANVKSGGSLVYSTCSITIEENELQIERFLKWCTDFSLTEIEPRIGSPGLRTLEKCQRLYPHIHDCNGFFIAKLQKD